MHRSRADGRNGEEVSNLHGACETRNQEGSDAEGSEAEIPDRSENQLSVPKLHMEQIDYIVSDLIIQCSMPKAT